MNSALDLLSFAALSHSLSSDQPRLIQERIIPEPTLFSTLPPILETLAPPPTQEDDGDQTEEEDIDMGRAPIALAPIEEVIVRKNDQLPSLPAFATFLPTNDSLKLIISATSLPSLPLFPTLPPIPNLIPHLVPEDSGIIRCVCSITSDDGFTIQCDGCNAWLHASCVSILPEEVPEVYLCGICDPNSAKLRGVNSQKAKEGQRRRLEEEDSKELERETDLVKINTSRMENQDSVTEELVTSPITPITMEEPTTSNVPSTILRDAIGRKRRVGKQPNTPSQNGPGRPRTTSLLVHNNSEDVNSPRLSSLGSLRGNQIITATSDEDDYGDDRFENWEYEFTPIEYNLWSDEKLIKKLKDILLDLTCEEETEVKIKLKELFTKQSVSNCDPTPIVLNALPNCIPTAVKPLVNLPFHLVPPVAASYIPSSNSNSQQCPYPRPTSYGLFSTTIIPPGQFIQTIVGKVSSIESYRRDPLNQYDLIGVPKAGVRQIGLPFSLIIDGRKFGNSSRFIRSGCHPNAYIKPIQLLNVSTEESKENWFQQKRKGSKEIVFGLFSMVEIGKKEEIILPWDWDDFHIVHSLPLLMNQDSLSKMNNLETLSKKMFLVSTSILSTNSCACEKKKDCVLFWICRIAGTCLLTTKKDSTTNLFMNALNSTDDKSGRGGGKKKVSSRKSDLGFLVGKERFWINKFVPIEIVEPVLDEVMEEVMQEEIIEVVMEEILEKVVEEVVEVIKEVTPIPEIIQKVPVQELATELKDLFDEKMEIDLPTPLPLTEERLAIKEIEFKKKVIKRLVPPQIEDPDSDSSDLTEPLPHTSDVESASPKKRKLSIHSDEEDDEIVKPPPKKKFFNNLKKSKSSKEIGPIGKKVKELEKEKEEKQKKLKEKKLRVKVKTVTRDLDARELKELEDTKEREKLKLQKKERPILESKKRSNALTTTKSNIKVPLIPAVISKPSPPPPILKIETAPILMELDLPEPSLPVISDVVQQQVPIMPVIFSPLVLSSVPPPPFVAAEPLPLPVPTLIIPEPEVIVTEPELPPPVEIVVPPPPPPPRARMSLADYRKRQAQQKPVDNLEISSTSTSIIPVATTVAPIEVLSDTPPIPAFIALPLVDSPSAIIESNNLESVGVVPTLDAAAVLKSIGDYFARDQSSSSNSLPPTPIYPTVTQSLPPTPAPSIISTQFIPPPVPLEINPPPISITIPINPIELPRPKPIHSFSESVAETVGRMNNEAAAVVEENFNRISRFSGPLRVDSSSNGLGLDTGLPSNRLTSTYQPRERERDSGFINRSKINSNLGISPILTNSTAIIANAYANVGTPKRNSSTPSPILRGFGSGERERGDLPKGPRSSSGPGLGSPPNRYNRIGLPPSTSSSSNTSGNSNLLTVRQTTFPDRDRSNSGNLSRTFNNSSPTVSSSSTPTSIKVLPAGPRGFTSSSNSTPLTTLPAPILPPPPSPILSNSTISSSSSGRNRGGWNSNKSSGGWGTARNGGRFDPITATIPTPTPVIIPTREPLPSRDAYDGVPRGPASMNSGGGFPSQQLPTPFQPTSSFSTSSFQSSRGNSERGGRGRGRGWSGRGSSRGRGQ